MSSFMQSSKSQFVSDLYDPQNINDLPNNQKAKRESEEFVNLADAQTAKKQKIHESGFDSYGESRQKALNVMNRQLKVRKQIDDDLVKSLAEVIAEVKTDHDVLKNDFQKSFQLTECFMKCMRQSVAAHKEKHKAFDDVIASFKKATEGLLLRGAIKPDDRPLWFDVYKAFPPAVEPKFARPKPENLSIRPILYKEDVIRAKFHAKGHGLSVNMLNTTGETQTRRLVQTYQRLQSEGVVEEELVQKSAEAVESTRRTTDTKMSAKNPESVTAKVLAEADLKNIFKG